MMRPPLQDLPYVLQLGAKISYTPIMNLEDVQKGLSQLGR
ncbi:hypothetical protein QFZ76_005537 [Streptomyces sp. V4I2]|nr:hypothetical protein [Streptomyces sp. V4I2]